MVWLQLETSIQTRRCRCCYMFKQILLYIHTCSRNLHFTQVCQNVGKC